MGDASMWAAASHRQLAIAPRTHQQNFGVRARLQFCVSPWAALACAPADDLQRLQRRSDDVYTPEAHEGQAGGLGPPAAQLAAEQSPAQKQNEKCASRHAAKDNH
eukprot:GHVT01030690.1.p1 GENE.GHVT01030690.1~~GHVT01030690.1.p1  ORF type:complete len:105 (-),score=24.04 GHVT01030690.1:328-642(-)